MVLENLQQPPYNTSRMGVFAGAASYYDLDLSPEMLYGGSGHAFMMNIHDQLCPSSPYVFNPQPIRDLSANLGLVVEDLGFFHLGLDMSERTSIENTIRSLIDEGTPCGVMNMDFQLIAGYDESGFILTQPWGPSNNDTTPGRLSFKSWQEFGDGFHASFVALRKGDSRESRESVIASLKFATEIYEQPERYTERPYGMGENAFANWIHALQEGHGSNHGAWWNGVVWSECRQNAGGYLNEVASTWPGTAPLAGELSTEYTSIASALKKVSDREIDASIGIAALEEARDRERAVVDRIPDLISVLEGM